MSPDVIDLISSSPPRSAISTEPPPRALLPPSRSGSSCRRSWKPRELNPTPSRSLPGLWQNQLSSVRPRQPAQGFDGIDDFNDDLADSVFDLPDDWQATRKRAPEQDDEDKYLRKATPSISKSSLPLKAQDGRCRNTTAALEPIELTSPANRESPREKHINISEAVSSPPPITANKTASPVTTGQVASLVSDPFASSPPRAVKRRKAGARASSVDVLSSSSPLTTASCRIRTTGDDRGVKCHRHALLAQDSVDLTVEFNNITKRGVVSNSQTPKEAVWPAFSKDRITIDSSDSLSDTNDELPAITDMDVSKRRARSPLRRSQSDLTSAKPKNSHAAVARKTETALAREAEKSRKRRERDEAKAIKAAEKQHMAALAEVNKLRTDKKVSAPEMIVDLPSGLGSDLQIQTQELLQGLGVQHCTWHCPEHRIVKWRRKVTCKFNKDICLWEPVPLHIVDESIAVLILTAEEFVAIALESSLADHVADIKNRYGDLDFMYILQGLTLWFRKNRSNRNRQFACDVRSANAVTLSSSSSRARTEHVSEDLIEEALLGLQVEHGRLIHHTTVASETARWIVNFTQHVSTIPYKRQRDQATSAAGFCMDSGQVRTGDSAQDTYFRMLQEIVRVTAPIAYGIATEFDSVTKLVHGLEHGGPSRLDAVRKSANKDGAVSDRTIGQAISRRMHKVFTGRDEESTNV